MSDKIISSDNKFYKLLKKLEKKKYRDENSIFKAEGEKFLGENINFNKIFFSCNAIKENDIMTSTFEESYTQEIALSNSEEKYLLTDDSKFEKIDFINFYTLDKLTGIVINNTEKEILNKIEKYVNLII